MNSISLAKAILGYMYFFYVSRSCLDFLQWSKYYVSVDEHKTKDWQMLFYCSSHTGLTRRKLQFLTSEWFTLQSERRYNQVLEIN